VITAAAQARPRPRPARRADRRPGAAYRQFGLRAVAPRLPSTGGLVDPRLPTHERALIASARRTGLPRCDGDEPPLRYRDPNPLAALRPLVGRALCPLNRRRAVARHGDTDRSIGWPSTRIAGRFVGSAPAFRHPVDDDEIVVRTDEVAWFAERLAALAISYLRHCLFPRALGAPRIGAYPRYGFLTNDECGHSQRPSYGLLRRPLGLPCFLICGGFLRSSTDYLVTNCNGPITLEYYGEMREDLRPHTLPHPLIDRQIPRSACMCLQRCNAAATLTVAAICLPCQWVREGATLQRQKPPLMCARACARARALGKYALQRCSVADHQSLFPNREIECNGTATAAQRWSDRVLYSGIRA
jgi:hypothetical protein